ncbi:MAG TPA: hypothetical protein VKB26_07910 [Candidatus Acidoferrales bacterium]|nr:hypothetical protein [Candidatus Acidoferrales bacterium]
MSTSQSLHLQPAELRGIFDDALCFWEPRRILYNLILIGVVAVWVVGSWKNFHAAMFWPAALLLFVMAALANVLYSSAYCLEVFIQLSSFRDSWRRHRWMLWLAGVILAVALANVWILGNFH